MKKLISFICLFFIISTSIFSITFNTSVGYSPIFFTSNTDNELVSFNSKSNGITAKTNYFFNDKIGLNITAYSSLIPVFSITEKDIYGKEVNKISKKGSGENYTSVQFGVSLLGDCDTCYFLTQLNIDTSILKLQNETTLYNGLCLDWSYNKPVKKALVSLGFNAGSDFIQYKDISLSNYGFNAQLTRNLLKIIPYVSCGINF